MKSSSSQHLYHSLKLRSHAAEMRQRHNAAEAALWQLLRAGKQGVWFRRQVVLGSCIVDFCCLSARVVVEVDGAYHAEPARKRADARRDRRLAKAGYRVVRLSAELVLADGEAALRLVRKGAHGGRAHLRTRPSVRPKLKVSYLEGRLHLPVVSLRQAA